MTFQFGVPDRQVLNDFGKRWGIEFLGPPLGSDAVSDSVEGAA